MAIDLDEALERMIRLESAVADVADLPWADLPVAAVSDLLVRLETVSCRLPGVGYDAINRLRGVRPPAGSARLRDYIADTLKISAADAARRIGTAAALDAQAPQLPETAAAARHGLLGTEHVRIITDNRQTARQRRSHHPGQVRP